MEHSFPFNSVNHDRKFKAEDWAEYFKALLTNGVFPNAGTNLQVTADGTSMKIAVQPGKAWINGYGYYNDTAQYIQLTNADGATNRIDRIVLQWNHADRHITVEVKRSAYATTPIAPALQRNADIYELALADVAVNAGVTSITQANITDTRLSTDLCGYVSSIATPDTTRYYDQIVADLTEFKATNEANFAKWHDAKYAEFENWLSTMQNIPPADAAAYLQGQINSRAYSKLNCKKANTVYALSGLTVASGLVPCVFKADADFSFGDTFTMDGDTIAAVLPDGSGLEDGFFKAGTVLTGVYDTDNKTINFKSGGSDYDTLPAQVSNFYATRDNAKVTLTWTNPDGTNFSGVLILRKTGGYPQRPSDGNRVYSGTAGTYVDTDVVNGTQYYYRAYAYNSKKQYQTLYCVATGTPVEYVELGALPVGTLVGINEDSIETPYIVVHQGLPSADYDNSCNGTWLLRKDLISLSTSLLQEDAALIVQHLNNKTNQLIKTVQIPTDWADDNTYCVKQYNVKAFALAPKEVGATGYYAGMAGSKLDYFLSGYDDSASTSKRMAKFNGNASAWWERGCEPAAPDYFYIDSHGAPVSVTAYRGHYSRPAFILDKSTQMTSGPDENGCYKIL